MKVAILDKDSNKKGDIELPPQFGENVRPDLIQKAVIAIQANKRQPYGASPAAGLQHSTFLSKRRHKYKSTYGIGQSRTPRKVVLHRGTRFNFVGAFAPQTVGGRRAHPPKAEKKWDKEMNVKERRKAIRSALSATVDKNLVMERGHKVPEQYPFALESSVEELKKTKDITTMLTKLGLKNELSRTKVKTIRAGKGTMRGRKYRKKVGPLLVVSKNCALAKSARNIPGVTITIAKNLNTEVLAPGADIGRMTLFTEAALKEIKEKNLFM